MLTKTKKTLLVSLSVLLLAMLTAFGLSETSFSRKSVKADDETATAVAAIGDEKYETLAAAIKAAKDGDTVKLLADCSGNGIIIEAGIFTDKGLTVDFGGYAYTVGGVLVGSSGTGTNAFQLLKNNNITFRNGSIIGVTEGTKPAEDTPDWHGAPAMIIQNYSNLTLKNMVVSGGDETVYTMSNNNGDIVIENTTINVGKAKGYNYGPYAFDVCRFSTYPSVKVTVKGNSVINGDVEVSGTIGDGQNRQLNIEGGEFKGTFNVADTPANITISGGTFSNEVPKEYIAETSAMTENEDGTYTVKSGYVAQIGTTKYETLQAALDVAKNKTVKLLADVNENVTISQYATTLDLNGFTINGGTAKNKATLTITNNATIVDNSEAQTGTVKREDTAENSDKTSYYVIDIQNGTTIIKGGKFLNNSGKNEGSYGSALISVGDDRYSKYPQLTIKGGTFTQDNFVAIEVVRGTLFVSGGEINTKDNSVYAIENWGTATIKGGKINGNVACLTYSEDDDPNRGNDSSLRITDGIVNGNVRAINYGETTEKTVKVEITGGTINGALGTYVYNGEYVETPNGTLATIGVTGGTFSEDPSAYLTDAATVKKNADSTFTAEKAYLAKVGETSYYTMDEAFAAQTKSGEAIVLLRDYTAAKVFNSGSSARVIDLNGHTWTYTQTDNDCAAFEINYSDASVTVKNGTVVSGSMIGLIPSAMSGTITYNNSALVFENVNMTANGHSGFETNGLNTNDAITLKNCTLTVSNGYGIYFPSSGVVTIENTTIIAKTTGVQICSGSLEISGSTKIEVKGDVVAKTENDGAIEDGAAVSVVNRSGYKGLGNVTISGGTFVSTNGVAIKAYSWANKSESAFDNSGKIIAVTGGTFSSEIPADYCDDGYEPVANENGTYGVVSTYAAEVGGIKYATLQEAIAAAKSGDTISLLVDIANSDYTKANVLNIVLAEGVTFEGNGHIISGNVKITVASEGNVTINNVKFKDIHNGAVVSAAYKKKYGFSDDKTGMLSAIYAPRIAGSLVITNCEFDNADWEDMQITPAHGANITIKGNVFKTSESEIIKEQLRHIHVEMAYGTGFDYEGTDIELTITDNQIDANVKEATVGVWWVGVNSKLELSGNYIENVDSVSVTLSTANCVRENRNDLIFPARSQANVDKDDLARNVIVIADAFNSASYDTLKAAIAAAKDGEKVKLLADLTVDDRIVVDKAITIDLNGYTVTSTWAMATGASGDARYALVLNSATEITNGTFKAGMARAIGAYAAMTLTGMKVSTELTGGHACVALCGSNKSYTIENTQITGVYALSIFADNATVEIIDSVLEGDGNVLYHNGTNYGLKLTVSGTSIASSGSCGVYISGSTATVAKGGYQQASFSNCKITGSTAIEVKYTDLTLNDCTVIATDEKSGYKQNNNGPAAEGFAVVSTDNAKDGNTPAPQGSIKINGGTYTGPVGLGSLASVKEKYPEFSDSTVSISGGTFSDKVAAEYCADGFRVAKKGDTYAVVGKYIVSSQVTLGVDISFKYRVEKEGITKVEVSYYGVGATELTVYELTAENGVYTFTGITPQMIDRKISVTVYAGEYEIYDVVDYSVLDYLKEVLAMNKGGTTDKLVASLAYYGKAAMDYVGYDTEEVKKFITDNALQQSDDEISGVAESTGKIVKVAVKFDSQNKFVIAVAEGEADKYAYTIKVNGKEVENIGWQSGIIDGYKVYLTEGIAARYIAEEYFVEVSVKDGDKEVQTLKYNVAGYCANLKGDAKFGEMAKATYYYGVAAGEYAKDQNK